MDIGADRAGLEAAKKLLRLSLDDDAISNPVPCGLLCGPAPAILGGTSLCLHNRIEGALPGPGGDAGISAGQVCLGDVKIQLRLADGFVARIQQRRGLSAVASAEAFLFARFGIVDIEHTAHCSPVESESVFHSSNFLVRACQTRSSGGCISYTKRTANCVSARRA